MVDAKMGWWGEVFQDFVVVVVVVMVVVVCTLYIIT